MRISIRFLLLLLVTGIISAVIVFAQAPMVPGPMMPDMHSDTREPSEAEIELEKLSMKPYRPAWAPMPMLKGKVSMVPAMHQALSLKDSAARARSAFILGQIGSPASKDLLVKLLDDPSHAVKVHAGIALACMRDGRGLSTCEAALSKEAPWIRYYAAYGLWCINTPASKAALRKHQNNQTAIVSTAIKGALNTRFVAAPTVTGRLKPLPKGQKLNIGLTWNSAADELSREADWWWHHGNYEQSIRCHEAGVLIDPDYVEGYSVIAWLQWSLGRNDEAVRTLKRAVAAAPKDPKAYYELGYHYFNLKNYPEAEIYLRKSVQMGGDHFSRRVYAYTLEKQGKMDQALEQWKELIRLRPEDQAARRKYESLQTKMKTQYKN